MGRRLHVYEGRSVEVSYDVARCIHAARCVHGLPAVFDPGRKPWIEPGRAEDPEELVRVIETCPTGALTYRRLDGGPEERPAEPAKISISRNGPLFARGRVSVMNADGETIARMTRVALCRCGASADKPFCDGSHDKVGFSDS